MPPRPALSRVTKSYLQQLLLLCKDDEAEEYQHEHHRSHDDERQVLLDECLLRQVLRLAAASRAAPAHISTCLRGVANSMSVVH